MRAVGNPEAPRVSFSLVHIAWRNISTEFCELRFESSTANTIRALKKRNWATRSSFFAEIGNASWSSVEKVSPSQHPHTHKIHKTHTGHTACTPCCSCPPMPGTAPLHLHNAPGVIADLSRTHHQRILVFTDSWHVMSIRLSWCWCRWHGNWLCHMSHIVATFAT